ncbi:hypothetical protein [Gelidibacter salicanalis]|uniref:hypothetical protein n=1 Tax=Gelidibacter salicanalis TaxID=291193 RepID=UPI001F291E73|nr:hypothetical protein [Gelidibacter salicanalis]
MRNQELKSQDNDHRRILIGLLTGVAVALSPFYFTIYESVPDIKIWSTSFFTYESHYYESVYVLAWTLTNKLVPLLLLFIWFFTCRHWWYHAILVPISMYFYQILIIFNDDLKFADYNQVLYLLPVMALVIPSIYLIRAKIFNKINDVDKTMQDLEDEFKIRPKNFFEKVKDYF